MIKKFLKIDIHSILTDSIVKFDLYILIENNYVLYRSKNLEFSVKHRKHLIDKGNELFIEQSDSQIFSEYILNNIKNINSMDIPENKKLQYYYNNSKMIIEEYFNHPEINLKEENVDILSNSSFDLLERKNFLPQNVLDIMKFEYSTYTHSLNMSLLISMFLANVSDYTEQEIKLYSKGALLHDIGKSRVPEEVLLKPEKLEKEEWLEMQKHPQYGKEILKNCGIENNVIKNIAYCHHEKFDGLGYPEKLKGNEIPVEAQYVSLCDVFDALTTRRCYKSAVNSFNAFTIMLNNMQGSFNPELLPKFIKLFQIY